MRVIGLSLVLTAVLQGCTCVELPNAIFHCEPDGTCAEGFVCGADNLCRPVGSTPDAGADAGVDAGTDAGQPDAGTDAGMPDAGDDAGLPDAGDDAGLPDAGDDAGMPDAGDDAGMPDAGDDAGTDAGVDAGMDAGCTPTGAVDEPDMLQADVDCDGFDGDLSRAVFVDPTNGLDTNAGTRAAPVRTLAHALTLNREQVYLATGTAMTGALALNDAVAVYGGYDAVLSWSRTSMKSTVVGALTAQPADAGRVVLEQLDVQAPDAVTPGTASVALTLINVASTSRLTQLRLAAGRGADGVDGTSGSPVANGAAGAAGAALGDGGVGGVAANCGDAGLSSAGFPGGAGGDGTNGGAGANGEDTMAGGAGGTVVTCTMPPCSGLDGGAGLTPAPGAMSAFRPGDPPATFLGGLDAGVWFTVPLRTWVPAQAGRAGGGGGGGGALLDGTSALLARGGGAGGGGSGGCGARSGEAGQGGGASIGLVLFNASPTLRDVQLVSGTGGRGGNGGTAGTAGTGGPGGAGAPGESVTEGPAGSGGRGGTGGAGGPGRQGPGGWGGPLIGLFCGGTSAPGLDATTTWQSGTPGQAGTGDPAGLAGGQPASGFSEGCP